MALGLGYGLPFSVKRPVQSFAEDVALSVNNALADAAQREEAGNCLTARAMQIMQDVQTQPSLLIVPQLYKAGVLYDQLPTTRTNFLPNNSMAGATGSVLPTTWASGSIPAGFTFSVGASGQATANDGTVVNYVDVSVSGTATASGTFNLFFSAATGAVTATTGQTFTLSAYATCISGDITTPAMVLQVQEVSGSTFQAGTSTNIALASGAALQRVSAVRTFNQSGVTASRGRIGHPIVSGTTYSYTIRIASPQLERLGVATPMIATSTGAVTRLNESTNVVGLPPEFTVSRNTTATRVNSSGLIESVASGVPRIDWLGQSCPGLLVEASGQNLVPNGVGFISATGVQTSSVTDSPAAAISGTLCTKNEASGTIRYVSQTFSASALGSATTYSVSRFFKYNGVAFSTTLEASSLTQWGLVAWKQVIVLSAASGVTLGASSSCTGSVENFGNGWYRVNVRVTTGATIGGAATVNVLSELPAALSTGQGFLTACPQLEVGSIATTYIPTTTAAVSRAADVISASGALVSGLIGQTEGTMYAEVDFRNLDYNGAVLTVQTDNWITNSIQIQKSLGNTWRFTIRAASTLILNIEAGTITAGIYKVALAYNTATSGTVLAVNGSILSTQTASSIPACNSLVLGARNQNGTFGIHLNDRIRAAALYTTRLSNAELAALTAP